MSLTDILAGPDLFENTVLAKEILRLGLRLLSVVHLLLTVDQTTEVRLLATVAFIKGASVICILLWFAKVGVALICEAFVIEDALITSMNHSLGLNFRLVADEGSKNFGDGLRQARGLDVLLAAGA